MKNEQHWYWPKKSYPLSTSHLSDLRLILVISLWSYWS